MANEEHLAIIKQGVEAWNRWRKEHPKIILDLGRAVLNGAGITRARPRRAHFNGYDVSSANLKETVLRFTNLSGAILENADFTGARLYNTIFADTYLSLAKGLYSVEHCGPSYISIDTLYESKVQVS